jgi:hypothetical protein
MAEATRSLPRNNPSFYVASGAVTLALYRARSIAPSEEPGGRCSGATYLGFFVPGVVMTPT